MFEEMTFAAFESRYKDKSYIGSGGFAKVFKVFDHAKNYYVALKIADVRPEWKKFTLQNEVALVNSLPQHRNIARYDACYRFNTGFNGEQDFAVLKFYEYGNLEQFLTKQELSIPDKKIIIRGILDGIAFLNKHDVVHRDLKSQNILLHREDGVWTPKIIDFGLGRQIGDEATITNSAIGISYAYAAPEQIKNGKIYKNVDLWAVGVIIYRIIAGELPFQGRDGGDERSTQSQLMLSQKIVNVDLPEKLETLSEPYRTMIKQCLILDPTHRVQTAHDLIRMLNGEKPKPSPVIIPTIETKKEDAVSPILSQDETLPPFYETADEGKTEVLPIQKMPKSSDLMPPLISDNDLTNVEEERTEVIGKKPAIKPDPKPSPNPYVVNNSMPPVYDSITEASYEDIPANKTMIFADKTQIQKKEEPIESDTYDPKMGGTPKKTNKWLWYVIPIVFFIAVAASLFFFVYQSGVDDSTNISSNEVEKKDPLPKLDLKALYVKNEKAKVNPEELNKVKIEIETIIKKYPGEYEPHYLLAINRVYSNKAKESFQQLKTAAELSIRSKKSNALLVKMEKDKNTIFKELSSRYRGPWSDIIKPLEESN